MKPSSVLSVLGLHFAMLSLVAFGGANTVVPDMHRLATETFSWMTDKQFADYFAIAQASPGPNVLIVTLMGWHVAGLSGAFVATIAMCGPSCLLTYYVSRLWKRFETNWWAEAIRQGVVPLTTGLIASSAFIIVKIADHSIGGLLITIVTALFVYKTKINPFYFLLLGMILGMMGLV